MWVLRLSRDYALYYIITYFEQDRALRKYPYRLIINDISAVEASLDEMMCQKTQVEKRKIHVKTVSWFGPPHKISIAFLAL